MILVHSYFYFVTILYEFQLSYCVFGATCATYCGTSASCSIFQNNIKITFGRHSFSTKSLFSLKQVTQLQHLYSPSAIRVECFTFISLLFHHVNTAFIRVGNTLLQINSWQNYWYKTERFKDNDFLAVRYNWRLEYMP